MDKGELIHSTDVERINALVGGGYCVIVSLSETPNEPHNGDEGEREKEKTTKKSNK